MSPLAHAQPNNLGNLPVKNFSKKDYFAGTQNWQVIQDERGIVYAANNEGLLEFDGNHWRLYPLPNRTIVRSLAIAPDGKIYVGGQGEIGYFEGDEKGELTYHSLNKYLPSEHKQFADVWTILIDQENVYFMAYQMTAKWTKREMSISLSGEGYLFLDKIGDRFYVQKASGDFGYCENHLIAPFRKIDHLEGSVTSMTEFAPGKSLITTEHGELFLLEKSAITKWDIPDHPFFKNNPIYCASLLPNGDLVMGSTSAGMAILDTQGRILHQVNRANDLQNNTVLSIFVNGNGNIWLGLDNGIAFVHANSAVTVFFPDGDLEGTCYSAVIHNGNLYTATNTGIYSIPWKTYYSTQEKYSFKKIGNSGGQVWNLGLHHGLLLAGHQKGALVIENAVARQVSGLIGVWRFLSIGEQQLIAGHYTGLALFNIRNNDLHFSGLLDGSEESYRILAYENGHVWMAHPYRGIFKNKLVLKENRFMTTPYGTEDGLPSDFNNHLFQLKNKIVFTGEHGIFQFDAARDTFVPDQGFNEIFGQDAKIKYLRQDEKGNIWYVTDEEVGVLWIKDMAIDKSINRMPIPELSDKLVGGFEFILPIDEHHVLFATENGFANFDPSKYNKPLAPSSIVLSEVWLKGKRDSLLFGGHRNDSIGWTAPDLSHLQNALEFVFSSTDHEGQAYVEYAHRLKSADEDWSAWDDQTSLNINNLQPGEYTLLLKAKNKNGQESGPISFTFRIRPPWYASPMAKTFYGMLLVGTFVGLGLFQRRKYKKERAELETTYLQEQEKKEALVQESKAKINQLERQKLETEVQFKNQELAAATMNLLQKSEMLNAIQSSLEKLKKQDGKRNDVYGEINRLLKMVKTENDLSDEWERFSVHFDQVHSDFLKRLGEQYPNLSPNDFKLSAYLRMNLSTKEIASLMNISVRGVEASRYRLRKRMGLDTEVNLTEFLMKM